MSGSTITTYLTSGVSNGYGGIDSPLTIANGGNIQIANAVVGSKDFSFSSQTLTENSGRTMSFLRPSAGTAAPPTAALPAMTLHREAAAPPKGWTAAAAPAHGAVFDLRQTPHGGIQMMPTLQAG